MSNKLLFSHYRPFPLFLLTLLLLLSCNKPAELSILPPDELYGQLFHDVQTDTTIFPDSKTFPDCTPKYAPASIRREYAKLGHLSGKKLAAFINKNFTVPAAAPDYSTDSSSIDHHITALWELLQRSPDTPQSGTLIPLPYDYIVPGGRFREVYYWDSYFTMLGLAVDGRSDIMKKMIDNFSYLIDTCGFIPNGNRTYYLSRSQPPFYSMMVALLAQTSDSTILHECIPRIEKEYAFWMSGKDSLSATQRTCKRVVRLDDGSILNRYWDNKFTPRSESYREDIKTAHEAVAADSSITEEDVYRNIRAAAESGWDFSSRWLSRDNGGKFALRTIRTTHIIPVDLNALLYATEKMLSRYYLDQHDSAAAATWAVASQNRKIALYKYCWNSDSGYFFDYNHIDNVQTGIISVAGTYPLFTRLADTADAPRISRFIETHLLQPGGITPTNNTTGQQWDAPNGWAPLQWITIAGLQQYGNTELAEKIISRWVALNRKVYKSTYKMCEKYNVVDTTKEGGGGEYPTQDGFGWTNGVFRKLVSSK